MEIFLKQAASFLSADSIITDSDECRAYGSDWTKTPGQAGAVVLPRTTEEVSRVLKLCSEHKIAVIPSGGRTGLAGGAVAKYGELVLSLTRMNRIGNVDLLGHTVRVQAGATTQAVHEHCGAHGLTWPIDLAAKGSSQIGGNLSTNAGGVKVIRYGMTRKWVVGLQAVTMSGEIIELNQDLEKNNTGYDLIQLLIGAEGTLAVITEATLKLTRIPRHVSVLFFPLPDISAVLKLFEASRRGPFEILAFEFFSERCLSAVTAKLGRRSRLSTSGAFYGLMEIEMATADASGVESWLGEILESGLVHDGMLAQSSEERREVWGLREGITESLQVTAPLKKYDVSVPVRKMAAFLEAVHDLFAREKYAIELYLFGHIGDGSPHLNLLKPSDASLERFESDCRRLEPELFKLLKAHHGSVSAEHGVGLLKKHWVTYSRSPEEVRLFRGIKHVFDPHHLLNPGKLIDAS